jgi:hypothetical protein
MSIATLESRIEALETRMDEFTKQSGIIRKSSLEEAREYELIIQNKNPLPSNDDYVLLSEVCKKLDLYEKYISEAKSNSLSEEIIKAREKTDEYFNGLQKHYIFDGFGEKEIIYINPCEAQQLIQAEREAADKKE